MANQGMTTKSATDQATNPWAAALAKLQEWDPTWAAHCEKLTTNAWTGVLPTKFIALLWGFVMTSTGQVSCGFCLCTKGFQLNAERAGRAL